MESKVILYISFFNRNDIQLKSRIDGFVQDCSISIANAMEIL